MHVFLTPSLYKSVSGNDNSIPVTELQEKLGRKYNDGLHNMSVCWQDDCAAMTEFQSEIHECRKKQAE